MAMFRHLRNSKWTDLQTRALFFDFVTYHPYEKFFLSVRLNFEFLHIGEVVPTDSFRVMRLGFLDARQYVAIIFESIVHLVLVAFMYEDTVRCYQMAKYWFR